MTSPIQPGGSASPVARAGPGFGPSAKNFGAVLAARDLRSEAATPFAERGMFGADASVEPGSGPTQSVSLAVTDLPPPHAGRAGTTDRPDQSGQTIGASDAELPCTDGAPSSARAISDMPQGGWTEMLDTVGAAPSALAGRTTDTSERPVGSQRAATQIANANRFASVRPATLAVTGPDNAIAITGRAGQIAPAARARLVTLVTAEAHAAGLDISEFTFNGVALISGGPYGARSR